MAVVFPHWNSKTGGGFLFFFSFSVRAEPRVILIGAATYGVGHAPSPPENFKI